MKLHLSTILSLGFLCLQGEILVAQSPGSLDTSFNLTGKVTTAFGTGMDGASGVKIQPDGKIVVAGYSAGSGNNYLLAVSRYNSDGTLDTSFNGTGKVTVDLSTGYDIATCVAIFDNKIIAGGMKWSGTSGDNALIRLNNNGTLDSSFGNNGVVSNSIGVGDAGINSIAFQPDGKIVATGICTMLGTGRDFAIMRYNSDGSLDSTFGSNGIVTYDFNNSYDFPYSVVIQNDGKIIAGGATGQDPIYDFGIVRLDTLGAVDASYGNNGMVVTDFGKPDEWAYGSVLQADGKLILAGTSGSPYRIVLSRYNDNGVLDTTFNATGKVSTAITSHDEAMAITTDSSGKIIACGVSYNGSNQDFCLVRYLPNGYLDNTFGTSGHVTTDFSGGIDKGNAIVLQPDGKVVVAGVAAQDFGVARYITTLNTGIIDFSSSVENLLVYPNPIEHNITLAYTLKDIECVTIKVADVAGQLVGTVIQNNLQQAGRHEQIIRMPANLSAGVYFITIDNGKAKLSIKVVK